MRRLLLLPAILLAACGDDAAPADSGTGADGGRVDAAGTDAGTDGGARPDGGDTDAGTDAGPAPRGPMVVYVALSGDDEVVVFSLDLDTGELTERQRAATSGGPGPVAVDPDRRFLYAGIRGSNAVDAFAIHPATGELTSIDTTSIGDNPVYLSVDAAGGTLLWASYGGDRIGTHRIAADGSVEAAAVTNLGTRTNPHAILLDPSNRFAFVPNTNSDVVQQYVFDASTGALTANDPDDVDVPSGTGPRHLIFHPTLDLLYVVNEHADSVTLFDFDADAGTLSEIETVTTLPAGADGPSNTCADVHVHPSGDFLYASNRGHDSIAMFTLAADGRMTPNGHAPTEPRPREFGLDPTGRYLYAAGQDSGNLAAYEIEVDGTLTRFDTIEVGSQPLWVEGVELPGE